MLFPRNIEEKIGFDRIRKSVTDLCQSARGKKLVEQMHFVSHSTKILRFLAQTDQMQRLLASAGETPGLVHTDAFADLRDATVPGSFLQADQLHRLAHAIEASQAWTSFLEKHRDAAGLLYQLVEQNTADIQIARNIRAKIDENGDIRERATPELAEIRSKLISERIRARKTLEQVMQAARKAGKSPEDSSLTIRNGRLVIPVKAEYKRTFRGFIHDESASGNLAYIEPEEVLEINNHLVELEYREKREIIRILTKLTDMLRPEIPHLEKAHHIMGRIDFIRAKALYGNRAGGIVPQIKETASLRWINAIHPLLKISLQKQQRSVVPLSIQLDDLQRIIVISGPNAGGKSVCLKTVGLLQYMVQCGLPVPMAEGSETGLFRDLFIDIGDEQSIDNDLSTYSSHLRNMAHFERYSMDKSLFLIDEFGSGTDPHFGGAIAEAILEKLAHSGAKGIVTTHYTNLKKYADATPGIVNGQMRFDVKNLQPLYQLETGKPGSSFSLEIAAKTGLSEEILHSARNKIGTDQLQIDRLLNELETEKKYYEDQARMAREKSELLDMTLKNYQELKENLEGKKHAVLQEARAEARRMVEDTNREIENLVRAIREAKAEKELTKKKRSELAALKQHLDEPAERMPKKTAVKTVKGKIQVGDRVRIRETSSVGEVLSIQKNNVLVAFGAVKSQVDLQRLEKVEGGPVLSDTSGAERSHRSFGLSKKSSELRHQLDLRGKRGESALPAIEKFIDDAIMFGLTEVRIIHGKGEGILRRLVRDTLARHPGVLTIEDEHADRGGAGVSIVKLQ